MCYNDFMKRLFSHKIFSRGATRPTLDDSFSHETAQPTPNSGLESLEQMADKFDPENALRLREQVQFEREFFSKMDQVRAQKNRGYEQERVQELAERAFNQQLTSMEEIEAVANSDNPDVEKREISYGDQKITVYDLHGYPISFLQHNLSYKIGNALGANTATELQNNPSLWNKKRSEQTRYGGQSLDAVSNAISTSYVNTDAANSTTVFIAPGKLVYGFSHIPADSLLQVSYGDGGTSNAAGDKRHSELWLKMNSATPDFLDTPPAQGKVDYNEVQLRRYDEQGNPLPPDFLITVDGQISDATLRHAAHFGISIANLDREAYRQHSERRFNSIIDSLNEGSDYKAVRRALDEVAASPFSGGDNRQDVLGAWGPDDKPAEHYAPVAPDKLQKLRDLELKKRIEFIKNQLSDAIAKIESGGTLGHDLGVKHEQYDVARYAGEFMNELSININLPDRHDGIPLKTTIYDGDHPSPNNHRVYPGANSVYYDELAPLVDRYLAATK